ncbi:helix-turn-helix domain-containing protein (plasmid) [Lactococcus lactis]|uniref:Rgg/GadR/MutR family transcriptional regulator n=1 Tax=Lactococcus lactis TaxID=1358 RepID=UPI0033138A19
MSDLIYGKIFKILRCQKKYSLAYFEDSGISKSNLSKFERGRIMLSFEKCDNILQKMNISLAEYELIMHQFAPIYQESYLFELEQAEFDLNKERLEDLYVEIKESDNKWLVYTAKVRHEGLMDFEIQEIVLFLKGIEQWGYFELSLLFAVLDLFSTKEIVSILKDFEYKNRNYYSVLKYRRRIFQIVFRAAMILGCRGKETEARDILKLTLSPLKCDGIDFYIATIQKMTFGCLKYYFENSYEGRIEINRSLEIIQDLGGDTLLKYYKDRLNKLKIII